MTLCRWVDGATVNAFFSHELCEVLLQYWKRYRSHKLTKASVCVRAGPLTKTSGSRKTQFLVARSFTAKYFNQSPGRGGETRYHHSHFQAEEVKDRTGDWLPQGPTDADINPGTEYGMQLQLWGHHPFFPRNTRLLRRVWSIHVWRFNSSS